MIDFSLEKELVSRNYRELMNRSNYSSISNDESNTDDLEKVIRHHWVYSKKNNECAMVSLDYDVLNEKWILSYPMKNSKVNYVVNTDTQQEALNYLQFVLSENALE